MIEKKIQELVEEDIKKAGFILYGVEYLEEDGMWILRVMIEHETEKITLDDCVTITEIINPLLDREDPIENEYMLEVCSAGAEKPLRNKEEYKKALNEYVCIKTKEENYGYLEAVLDDSIVLKINLKGRMKNIDIKFEDIESARLAIKF